MAASDATEEIADRFGLISRQYREEADELRERSKLTGTDDQLERFIELLNEAADHLASLQRISFALAAMRRAVEDELGNL